MSCLLYGIQLTPQGTVRLEILTCMESEVSWLCSQKPATGTSPSQLCSVHTLVFCFLTLILILSSNVHLLFRIGLFPCSFLSIMFLSFHCFHAWYMPCRYHLFVLVMTLITFGEEYTFWNCTIFLWNMPILSRWLT